MELSDLLLSTEVQSRLLHCTAGWNTNTVGVCTCVWSYILWPRKGCFRDAVLIGGEERRVGLDGILVTCSCYWLHFVALCVSTPWGKGRQERRRKEKKGQRREDERRGMQSSVKDWGIRCYHSNLLLWYDWLHFVATADRPALSGEKALHHVLAIKKISIIFQLAAMHF